MRRSRHWWVLVGLVDGLVDYDNCLCLIIAELDGDRFEDHI